MRVAPGAASSNLLLVQTSDALPVSPSSSTLLFHPLVRTRRSHVNSQENYSKAIDCGIGKHVSRAEQQLRIIWPPQPLSCDLPLAAPISPVMPFNTSISLSLSSMYIYKPTCTTELLTQNTRTAPSAMDFSVSTVAAFLALLLWVNSSTGHTDLAPPCTRPRHVHHCDLISYVILFLLLQNFLSTSMDLLSRYSEHGLALMS